VTRRGFMGAAALTPFFIRADDKNGRKPLIIGEGDYQYEWIADWGELPSNIKYGNCHALAEDSAGNIYVLHTVHPSSPSGDSVVVFDSKGKFVSSWGWEFRGGAHGLLLRKEGNTEYLYISDSQHRIVSKRTLKGEEVWTLGYPSEAKPYAANPGIPYRPTNVAVAANGDIYVGDGYGSSYINQYDHKGKYIRTFGGIGNEAGKLSCPHGIIVDIRGDKEPVLLIADRGNNRIQRFTLDGKHIDFIEGTIMPCHFGYSKNGDMVVPDLAARVTLMDRSNRVIEHLGDDSASEWRKTRTMTRDKFTPGKFITPHGACFDHADNIFVVEWVEVGRVTKLRKV